MFGWELNIFDNVETAITDLTAPWPAAVIIDLGAPKSLPAGLEVMRQMQSRWNTKVPYLVISSRVDWEARLAAVRSGAAAYLTKPVDIGTLDQYLERITRHDSTIPYRVLVAEHEGTSQLLCANADCSRYGSNCDNQPGSAS